MAIDMSHGLVVLSKAAQIKMNGIKRAGQMKGRYKIQNSRGCTTCNTGGETAKKKIPIASTAIAKVIFFRRRVHPEPVI
jgi:hypothetical protein